MTLDVTEMALWAEVDLGCIRRNVERLRGLLAPGKLLLAVVKADGYGHGGVMAARAALAGGADWLAVARVHEGAALRQAGISAPILLLAEPPPAGLPRVVELGLVATLYTASSARLLAEAARRAGQVVPVHVKVDTGMHRYGLPPGAIRPFLDLIAAEEGLHAQGIWSHFAVAEDVLNPYTRQQFECFCDVVGGLGARGEGLIRHLANSAALMTFPEAHFDLVRTGIATYGIYPSPSLADRVRLEPALALKSRVSLTKTLAQGDSVSYGQRFVLSRSGVIATVPCGYADGVRRGLTNLAQVLIGGRRYPMAGTVTMDHFMVDVGDGEVSPGDEVVLLGSQGGEQITAQEMANHLASIPYEVVCGISARVPRVYTGDLPGMDTSG